MMRVIEVGTFLLPDRLSLTWLLGGGRDRAVEALQAEFHEFSAPPPLRSDGLYIDFHRSLGARQMETMLFEGAIEHETVGLLRLYLSSLSVGFVVAELDLPDGTVVDLDTGQGRDEFKAVESSLTRTIAPLITEWVGRIIRTLRPEWTEPRPGSAMPASELLWWHRIATDAPAGSGFAAPRLFGVHVSIGDEGRCSVANGFTNIHGLAGPLVDHVVEGLMIATQEWVIVDEAQRLLSHHLVRLSQTQADDLISVDGQYTELLALTREVTLRKLILSEEQRYLDNTRAKIKQAATESWHLAEETRELDERIAALRDLFAVHRDRITNDRDDRRNNLIYIFTVITVIQSVLLWYDFLTQPNITVAGAPRSVIAIAVLALTVAVLLGALWGRVRQARRVRRMQTHIGERVMPHQRRAVTVLEGAPDAGRASPL